MRPKPGHGKTLRGDERAALNHEAVGSDQYRPNDLARADARLKHRGDKPTKHVQAKSGQTTTKFVEQQLGILSNKSKKILQAATLVSADHSAAAGAGKKSKQQPAPSAKANRAMWARKSAATRNAS